MLERLGLKWWSMRPDLVGKEGRQEERTDGKKVDRSRALWPWSPFLEWHSPPTPWDRSPCSSHLKPCGHKGAGVPSPLTTCPLSPSQAQEDVRQQLREFEETKKQIEEDEDREIQDIKTKYEKKLRDEKESNLRLKGETGIMRKKVAGCSP